MKKGLGRIAILAFCLVFFNLSGVVWAGETGSPEQVLKKFTQAYFMLDPSMGEYLSKDARYNDDNLDMVEFYLDIKKYHARYQGYGLDYFKMQPIRMEAQVLNRDDSSATLKYNVETIRSINPLFRAVGFIFGLLEKHHSSDTITMVKEDGQWKVGPGAFDLPEPM